MGSLIKSLVRMIIILVIIISPVSPIESGYIKRLSALGGQGASYAFAYDGMGNRYQQIVDGKPQTYALDLAGGLSQVLYDEEFSYIYGLERLAQQANTGEYETFLPDRLGSVRQLASASGFPSFAQEFDPFGGLSGYVGRGSSHYGFAGEWIDSAGLQYLRARYYSPAQGRFISRDPFPGIIDQPASLNPYSYALNNPVLYTDPSGENPFILVGVLGGVLGGSLYGYGSQVIRNLNQGLCFWDALSTNIDAAQVALFAGMGTLLGLGLGAGMIWAGSLLAPAAVSTPPVIDFLENQIIRVEHIMQSKHSWGLITQLSGNLMEDYRDIQPYLAQVMQTIGKQISTTPQGPLIQYIKEINGQLIVVNAIKLIDGTLKIVDAWVKTR